MVGLGIHCCTAACGRQRRKETKIRRSRRPKVTRKESKGRHQSQSQAQSLSPMRNLLRLRHRKGRGCKRKKQKQKRRRNRRLRKRSEDKRKKRPMHSRKTSVREIRLFRVGWQGPCQHRGIQSSKPILLYRCNFYELEFGTLVVSLVLTLLNLNQVPPSCQALTKLGLAIAKGSNIDGSLQKMILGFAGAQGGHNGGPNQPASAFMVKCLNDTRTV